MTLKKYKALRRLLKQIGQTEKNVRETKITKLKALLIHELACSYIKVYANILVIVAYGERPWSSG